MSNNELKITLNISDELLAKVVIAMKQSNSPLAGIPPQLLAGLIQPKPAQNKDKATVGFKTK